MLAYRGHVRFTGVVIAVAIALTAFSAGASANVMVWRASLSGSYTSDATTTDQECGEDYNTPLTVTSSETGTLKTTKAALFDAWHAGKKPELAIESDMKPLKLAGSKTRTSGLSARDVPNGCNGPAQTSDCSTKSFSSLGTLYGMPIGRKLQVALSLDMDGVFKLQGGEWERCALAMGQASMPNWTNPKDDAAGLQAIADIPLKKLFAKHPRPFTVKGTLARSGSETLRPATSTWQYRFDFTLKFTFVRHA
jgi:hypothetical protein